MIRKYVDGEIRGMARSIDKEGVAAGLSGAEQIGACEVFPNAIVDATRILEGVGEELGREIGQLLHYRGEDFLTPTLHCLMSR
ncbi:hypothetical protein WL04_23065 [Burkholderia ubonensis]|nr:hypothetical protein WM36_13575 [Burkholderia ubonensis]KVD34399.1 hypothetical protein WI84_19530 [Burkholderia ubonensis]KVP94846.1 hypothetical protein WJ97_01995 [Burkholderia ubonensis]KVX20939.1 hypothetical protein WL03_07890 [Burkholderia ubonensis]KVX29854.1 hypothetical protein WL04_23065 [Burkholderia ubonensis]